MKDCIIKHDFVVKKIKIVIDFNHILKWIKNKNYKSIFYPDENEKRFIEQIIIFAFIFNENYHNYKIKSIHPLMIYVNKYMK